MKFISSNRENPSTLKEASSIGVYILREVVHTIIKKIAIKIIIALRRRSMVGLSVRHIIPNERLK